tara:strand:- start:9709 stop:9873 length:165 start_codon:yes stop_codon:yes gene_type:complete
MTFNILLIIAGAMVVLLILREVICWYFKINKSVDIQQKILNELVKLNKGEEINE